MTFTNFSLSGRIIAAQSDWTDLGIDVDEVGLRGTITLTTVTSDNRPFTAPSHVPPSVVAQPNRFTGTVVDGELQEMRVLANDPDLGVDSLFYRVDFDLYTPAGQPVKMDPQYIEAPSSDVEVDLSEALLSAGTNAMSVTRIAPGGVRLDNNGRIVFTFGGIDLADPLDLDVGPDGDDAGFDLIILAGQSNMAGAGIPYNSATDPSDSRVWQYATAGSNAGQIILASEPLAVATATGIGPGLGFGRWYAATIPTHRRVLLVPVAVGGTPLVTTTPPTWNSTVSGSLYSTMITQTQAALAAAGANARIVACLWVQGESDAISSVTGANYRTALDALVVKLRTDLSAPNLPFIVGQIVPDHLPRIFQTRTEINAVQAVIGTRLTKTAFAYGPFGQSQADNTHYTSTGQRTLARSMFDAYRRIVNGVADPALPSVPGQVTGVTVSGSVTATYVVSWNAVSGASGYYVDRSASSGGTYTLGGTTTGTSLTVTRLTSGAVEYVRVRALNGAGAGTASSIVTASVAADTTAPSTPGTPTATAGVASATLTFSGSTDNVAVTGYRVYGSTDGFTSVLGTGTASPVTVTGLTPGVPISFRVAAIDAAGNQSAQSSTSNAVTPTNYFVLDTFTDTVGKSLTAHTPEIGGTWSSIGWNWTNTFKINSSGGVTQTIGAEQALNLATPPSADYATAVDVTWTAPIQQQWASVYARAQINTTNSYNHYELRWFPTNVTTAGLIEIWKFANWNGSTGTRQIIATGAFVPTAGVTYKMTLRCVGTTLTATIGTTTVTVTDSTLTSAGYAGFGTNGTWAPDGVNTPVAFDNFTAG